MERVVAVLGYSPVTRPALFLRLQSSRIVRCRVVSSATYLRAFSSHATGVAAFLLVLFSAAYLAVFSPFDHSVLPHNRLQPQHALLFLPSFLPTQPYPTPLNPGSPESSLPSASLLFPPPRESPKHLRIIRSFVLTDFPLPDFPLIFSRLSPANQFNLIHPVNKLYKEHTLLPGNIVFSRAN